MSSTSGMSMSTSMTMSMASTTSASTAAASSTGMSMGGMDMGAHACKINMLWNWYTIDACFLSESWHIRSKGMFAGTCIGIAFLVVSLEGVRVLSREYDLFIVRQFQRQQLARRTSSSQVSMVGSPDRGIGAPEFVVFRASPLQQLVRSILHAITFGVAYIIMLLAMYYNGYVIISIIIGAGLGKFLCDWMVQKIPVTLVAGVPVSTGEAKEPTVCCG